MEILLRQARIIHAGSSLNNKVQDILISGGKIKKIGNKLINSSKAKEISFDNLHVSIGWFDLNTFLADPGYEQRETIESGCKAAAAGGFTHICCMPNTNPVIQSKSQIEYVLKKSDGTVVSVHPIGAITQDTDGHDLAEMYDMYKAGAVAFSDGLKPSATAGLVERALLYVKTFKGLIMNHPEDKSISKNGVMHEGVVSIKLGLEGTPALAEEIAVNRDLYILEYTDSRLHLMDVSLRRSVELIRAAKRKGLQVTASVNAYNLLLDQSAVGDYNTNNKTNPPLRAKEDIAALVKGLEDGTIDTITSAHQPHDEEGKKLEFDKAEYGMIGLETCFAIAQTKLNKELKLAKLIKVLSINPRTILGLPVPEIKEGQGADLTLFDPDMKWKFGKDDVRSKSANTSFIGTEFTGRPIGVINKGKLYIN